MSHESMELARRMLPSTFFFFLPSFSALRAQAWLLHCWDSAQVNGEISRCIMLSFVFAQTPTSLLKYVCM